MATQTQRNLHRPLKWSEFDLRYRAMIGLFVITLVCGLGWSAFYHHSQFVQADTARIAAISRAKSQQQQINQLIANQQKLLAQEKAKTIELTNARAIIARLQNGTENHHL